MNATLGTVSTVLGIMGSLTVVIPFIVRLLIGPLLEKKLERHTARIEKRLEEQARRMERRLDDHIKNGGHLTVGNRGGDYVDRRR